MDKKLIEEIKQLNILLTEKYRVINKFNREEKREELKKIGEFFQIDPLDIKELEDIKNTGGVIAVDGSTNSLGGAYPHYIQLFKAVASTGLNESNNLENVDIYCPLVDEGNIFDEKSIVDGKLAEVEVKIAIESTKLNPKIILMDGSLIRYNILCKNYWERLREIVIEKGIILVGVIEDVKTSIAYSNVLGSDNSKNSNEIIYDREFLFDTLNYLEALYINKKDSGKDNYGFRSCFYRSSKEPSFIAVDILEEQDKYLMQILSLIASITDKSGRGVPFILDIVDVQTRISNDMIKQIIKNHIDIEFYEKLFNAQRSKRSF